MKRFWVSLLFLCCLVPVQSLMAGEREDSTSSEHPAKIAENWLALVDDHKYRQSWKEASLSLQNAVPEDRWRQVMATVREALGELDSRKLSKIKLRDKLPGLPNGDYAVAQFATSFEGKMDAIETVFLAKEGDNLWKVCGYYVK
jgi:hypothetical protein